MVHEINGPSGDGFKELYLKQKEVVRSQPKATPSSADIKEAIDRLKEQNDNNTERPIKGFNLEHSDETFVTFEGAQTLPEVITKTVSYLKQEEGEAKPMPSTIGQEEGEAVPLPSELDKEGGLEVSKQGKKPQITEEQLEKFKDLLKQFEDTLKEKPKAEFKLPEGKEWQKILDELKSKENIRDQVTTKALGEEGGDIGVTTKAMGEEGGSGATTMALGEEGGDIGATTKAMGEEGGSEATTMALGEEGGDIGVTTKAMGEEGGSGMTTMALGEEGGGYQPSNPTLKLDEIIEKLKEKYPELFVGKFTEADIRQILEKFQAEN